MPLELYSNLGTTTVTSGGTTAPAAGTVETWTVSSSTSFPAASNATFPPSQFRVQENDQTRQTEIMTVTHVAGTTWTVTRGTEGTTPVAHPASFTIVQTITAGVLNGLATVAGMYLEAMVRTGAASVGANTAPPGLRVPVACTLNNLYLWASTGPTGAALTVSVVRGGGSIATVTIAAGALTGTNTANVALAKGDILTFDITAVGSTVPGSDIALCLEAF